MDTLIWPDSVGGVEAQVDAVSRHMARLGHEVRLLIGSLPAGSVRRLPDGRQAIGIGCKRGP